MRQFLKYEFKNNWKNFLLSFILIISSFLILSLFVLIVRNINTVSKLMSIIYGCLITLIAGSLIASAVLFIINIVKSMYNSIFTDEGYLTLSFPKPIDSLIISKILSVLVWELLYGLAAAIGVLFLFVTIGEPINELLNDLHVLLQGIKSEFVAVPFMIINGLISSILTLLLLFFAFTVINTGVAKKNKLTLGILLYLGLNYAISVITSILSFLSFGIALDYNGKLMFAYGSLLSNSFFYSGATMYVFDITLFIFNVGMIIGTYFLTRHLLKNYLELE